LTQVVFDRFGGPSTNGRGSSPTSIDKLQKIYKCEDSKFKMRPTDSILTGRQRIHVKEIVAVENPNSTLLGAEDQSQENLSVLAVEKMEDVIKKVLKEMLGPTMKNFRNTQ